MLSPEVHEVLRGIADEVPYPIQPRNDAILEALSLGLAHRLDPEAPASVSMEGDKLLIWKDLALTPQGLDALVEASASAVQDLINARR